MIKTVLFLNCSSPKPFGQKNETQINSELVRLWTLDNPGFARGSTFDLGLHD